MYYIRKIVNIKKNILLKYIGNIKNLFKKINRQWYKHTKLYKKVIK